MARLLVSKIRVNLLQERAVGVSFHVDNLHNLVVGVAVIALGAPLDALPRFVCGEDQGRNANMAPSLFVELELLACGERLPERPREVRRTVLVRDKRRVLVDASVLNHVDHGGGVKWTDDLGPVAPREHGGQILLKDFP